MVAMAALQNSFTSLSISSNSFLGQPFSPLPLCSPLVKSTQTPGSIVAKIEAPIHSSNVMLCSKDQKVASRVGHKALDNGKRVRYLIKTGEIIDSAENWKKAVKEKEKTTEAVAVAT
ncbi:hypothetical protein MTR67_042205 [Solanum verrucosum]|uniref:Large ribosomal subunit protein uL24 C-terminal domain-containing protein n=1 Tax=Solanum verrucosum TaxID=315347 RepID=A0AAF0UM09_SOLVR|nr:hypothetical protein MTR67_042205 [Solanum verrucosum]